MHSTHTWLMLPIALAVLALPGVRGQTPSAAPGQADNPFPYAAAEPKAQGFSLSKGAEYLDGVARFWMRDNSCGACHANFAYLMARPLVGEHPSPLLKETRQFLETRTPNPRRFSFDSRAVSIAFALAWDDARSGGKLQPSTRQTLRHMWGLQKPHGGWNPLGCGEVLPPETDGHYTVTLAALAAGVAPEGYARTPEAQDGLTKLRRYLVRYPARILHDDAMRLWASLHVDGLMTAAGREATAQSLLAAQGQDGGWSLPALSTRPTPAEARKFPSDGYGTAFVIYVLRQAGVPATRPEIARGVGWLRSNQRASGRWFTPAPVSPTEGGVGSRDLYAQNLGTAFAVLALKACEGTDRPSGPGNHRQVRRTPGLWLRDRLIPD
jgi:squalene-hopene/tetraprenyl-beta-curcumene cyclase